MAIQRIGGETTFPIFLGLPVASLISGIGVVWDVGINGEGYLLSVLDQESPFEYRAYTVSSIPIQKDRIDSSEEPGEQTLEAWWTRAQHSWHNGAGQKVFDSPMSSRFGFYESKGIDPWEDGELTLLKDTASFDNGSDDNYLLLTDGGYLFYSEGDAIIRIDDLDTPTPVSRDPSVGNSVVCMTSDGTYIYAGVTPAIGDGILRSDIAAHGAYSKINNLNPDVMAFVKNRLICGVDGDLHEVIDLSSLTSGASSFFTHIYADWQWTGIAETGPAIFAAGFAGERSGIFAIGLETADLAAGLTIGVPREVWTAPEGEIIHTVKGYLGSALIIGTSKGIRRGVVASSEGDLEVSPLIVETDEPVRCFTFQGNYCWFGWSKFDGTSSGIGKLDLGTLAYASDLMYAIQGDVHSVVDFGDRLVYTVNSVAGADSRVIYEHPTNYVTQGWMRTGEIRFGTFEDKSLRYFDGLLIGSGGTLDLEIAVDLGSFVAVLADQAVGDIAESITQAGTRFDLKIFLNTKATDATIKPTLLEWRLRADPDATGRFRYFVPVMLYDKMKSRNNRPIGGQGYGYAQLAKLTTLYRNGTVFKLQSPSSSLPDGDSPVDVKVEDLQFKSYTPPQGASGLGGICLVVMREQA